MGRVFAINIGPICKDYNSKVNHHWDQIIVLPWKNIDTQLSYPPFRLYRNPVEVKRYFTSSSIDQIKRKNMVELPPSFTEYCFDCKNFTVLLDVIKELEFVREGHGPDLVRLVEAIVNNGYSNHFHPKNKLGMSYIQLVDPDQRSQFKISVGNLTRKFTQIYDVFNKHTIYEDHEVVILIDLLSKLDLYREYINYLNFDAPKIANFVSKLSKGEIPFSLIEPSAFQSILDEVYALVKSKYRLVDTFWWDYTKVCQSIISRDYIIIHLSLPLSKSAGRVGNKLVKPGLNNHNKLAFIPVKDNFLISNFALDIFKILIDSIFWTTLTILIMSHVKNRIVFGCLTRTVFMDTVHTKLTNP